MINKIWQHKNMKESLLGAIHGLLITLKTERNAKIILIMTIIAVALGLALKVCAYEFMIIILVSAIVSICEVFNTLVENILDMIQPDTDPKIKILKDISSAAVLTSTVAALIIGIIIFIPKIISLIQNT